MAPAGTHSSSKSRNSSGKKVPKGRGSPSLHAIKSLPAEYRLMERTSSVSSEGIDHQNGGVSENGNSERVEYIGPQGEHGNDDSPYGGRAMPMLDEDPDIASSPVPSIPPIAETKWNDTASYTKKKVLCSFFWLDQHNVMLFVFSAIV